MNFALILFLLTVGCGVVVLADRLVFASRRRAAAQSELAEFDRRSGDAPSTGSPPQVAGSGSGSPAPTPRESARHELEQRLLREPWWIEYPKSFFPVLLIVFLLRSFLAEPFKIPSSSMRPTLEVGDFILVNKFAYGIRLPIIERKIIPLSDPRRGDVVVFRYPLNPSQDFIKRVIGLPGDTVVYRDKKLTVNGTPWPQTSDGTYSYLEGMRFETMKSFSESVQSGESSKEHTAAADPTMPPVIPGQVRAFAGRDNCDYNPDGSGFACKVPAGSYFVMGDNRDRSDDSRYWGFVPDDHLRGRAFFIWFNWDDISSLAFKRIGSGIR